MPRALSASAAVVIALLTVSSLPGQEPSHLGINLSIVGSSRVGVTYYVSDAVALRPGIGFQWYHDERTLLPGQPARTFGQFGMDLDVLFPLTRDLNLRPYLGLGSGLWFDRHAFGTSETAHTLAGGALFGVFVRVLARVHVYGEVALRYSATRGADRRLDRVGLSTLPIGVLVYLR